MSQQMTVLPCGHVCRTCRQKDHYKTMKSSGHCPRCGSTSDGKVYCPTCRKYLAAKQKTYERKPSC